MTAALQRVTGRTWADRAGAHSSVTVWVACDPATCFDYVADINRHPEWTTHPVRITNVQPGATGVGARYLAVGRQAGKDWPSELEVTVYDRTSVFEFVATGGPIGTPEGDPHRHYFTFTPDEGGTRIELVRTDPFPPNWSRPMRALGPLMVRLSLGIRKRTIANLQERLQAMATRRQG